MEKIFFNYKNKKIKLSVKKVSEIGKGIGLMFSSRKRARALLFEFKNPEKISIHSLFVFFPFVALWLDDENKVVDIKKVNPFRLHVSSRKPYRRLIEIPMNGRYDELVKILVGRKDL